MAILNDMELHIIGESLVEPFRPEMVQPASIDVHLDRYFYLARKNPVANVVPEYERADLGFTNLIEVKKRDRWQLLPPNGFALGSTFEKITVPPNMVAHFDGKSSLARLGLLTHVTAGYIDPGFSGHITVEIKNLHLNTWLLEPGMKIGQVVFETLSGEALYPYGHERNGSHYQGVQASRGPVLSKLGNGYAPIDVYETGN